MIFEWALVHNYRHSRRFVERTKNLSSVMTEIPYEYPLHLGRQRHCGMASRELYF